MLTIRTYQEDEKLYYRVLAGNGKEMAYGGPFANKRNMADSIALLKAGIAKAKVVDEAA